MILLLISATLVILLILKSLIPYISMTKHIRKLPGPPADNFLKGNLSVLYGSQEKLFKTARKWGLEYFPIYQVHAAHLSAANLLHPDDFETVMSNSKHIRKSQLYDLLYKWLGTGLVTSDGAKWQTRRKILTPSFHFNILQDFIQVFDKETEKLVKIFKEHDQIVDISGFISDFTLNSVGETAMGISFDDENTKGTEYKSAIYEMGHIFFHRFLRPWLLNNFLFFFHPLYNKQEKMLKTLNNFNSHVIKKRGENFSYSKNKRLAMLDLLLRVQKEEGVIDDDGIREEVATFMFAGHDTVSLAICFALMLIACHPEVQERIVDEIQQVLSHSQLDYRTLQNLKYMEQCIKEVLRLYPSVPFIARVLGEDITTHSGHLLKAGSMVNLHIYDLHHNPDIYPDPEKFDPDRFSPENCQKRHTFAYVPFSAGPRNCIGQKFALLEIKTALVGILSAFVVEPVDTPETIGLRSEMVLRTRKGIRVKLIPRNVNIL